MKNTLNLVKNDMLIKITGNCGFCFLEENLSITSPVSDYYLKASDLSINLTIKLKWGLYAYFFMKSISDNVIDVEDDYSDNNYIVDSINPSFIYPREKHLLTLDEVDVFEISSFLKEMESEYTKKFYDENSVIHLKLKVNIVEFIILQNTAYPRLCFYE